MSTPTQTRVVASKPKIGARPPVGAAPAAPEPAGEPRKRSRTLLVVLLVVVLLGGGAAWWFLMGPGAQEETAEEPPAAVGTDGRPVGEPGEVLTTEAISINLANGHYLRIGLGLQLSADAEEVSTAKALDATISLFSGRPVGEVTELESRDALKEQLLHTLWEIYDGDVLDVYFTDFVTQ